MGLPGFVRPAGVAGVALLAAAGLVVGGRTRGKSGSSAAGCLAKHTAPGGASSTPGGSPAPAVAAGWTLPGGDLANTRDVESAITSSNVATLGVAWCTRRTWSRT
jgi:hypothetical protein